MKILHIYKDYCPVLGGIENHVRVLAEHQAAAGHEVTVLTCALGPATRRERMGGVQLVRAGRLATVRSMPISYDLPRLAGRLAADVVHVHTPFPLGECAALGLPAHQPLVVTHHADITKQRLLLRVVAPLLRRFLRRVDRIIITSQAYARGSPWLLPHEAKWRVVPLGTDVTVFTPEGARPADAAPLLFVGRLRYYKGLDTLFDALLRLPSVRLDIVGEGRMAAVWRARVVSLGIASRVRFLGDLQDGELPARYRGARIFVLPANCRAEAFGTVLIEAMACGIPCVTTEIGSGTSWVVQDGVTGAIVPPGDVARLAQVLEELLENEPRRLSLGRAARERAVSLFTLPGMLAGVGAVYREVATPSGAGARGGEA